MNNLTEQQIKDLLEWGGLVHKWGDYWRYKNEQIVHSKRKLLQSWEFLKSLESKMIEELKIVRMEWRLTPDRSQVTIIYMKHHYHLAEIEVEGSGSTEREAIINAIINYRRGK